MSQQQHPPQQHSPQYVIEQARAGRLEEWVHDFLNTVGGNAPFAAGLRLQPRHWLGPMNVPLDRLLRACGPEAHMEYCIEAAGWERRVGAMLEATQAGWQPPPLIAQYTASGELSLRDGNHRHEALRRHGLSSYWCVIWCDTERLWAEAAARLTGS